MKCLQLHTSLLCYIYTNKYYYLFLCTQSVHNVLLKLVYSESNMNAHWSCHWIRNRFYRSNISWKDNVLIEYNVQNIQQLLVNCLLLTNHNSPSWELRTASPRGRYGNAVSVTHVWSIHIRTPLAGRRQPITSLPARPQYKGRRENTSSTSFIFTDWFVLKHAFQFSFYYHGEH